MPLCEPIAVEEDKKIKWIREIDLDDLAIERNATDDKEYRIVYNNKWMIAHANSLNAIQHDYNQISTKLEQELKTLEETKDKMNSNKVVFNTDSYLYCFFQNQYLAAKSLEIHDMLRQNNRWTEAEQFIERNPESLSIIDDKGQVPLHIIAGAGQPDLLKFVLALVDRNNSKKGEKKLDSEVNTRDNNNWTPLHCAAFSQHFKCIEVLVRDGNSHVCCLTDKNYTAMHFLARWQHKDEEENKFNEVIKLLMDRGADINAQAMKGEAPIHEACLHAPVKTVKALLALGADLHLKTVSGDNVLHFAIRAKNFDLAEFLVEKGVDLTAEGEEGTPLELANQIGDTHIVNMLKLYRKAKKATYIPSPGTSPPAPMSPTRLSMMSSAMDKSTFGTKFTIHDAVTKNQSDRVVFFIQDDESLLNARNDSKWTPALLAAAYGYFDLLKILISRPTIEVNCVTPDGSGILHYCFRNFINQQKEKDTLNDIVSMLMEKRLDLNLKNNYGQTALHEAAQRGNLAAVDILIKHRAEINAITKNGETPLHYAARGGHLEVIKLLLANKADKHRRGKRGTALDVASNAEVVRVIKMYRMPHGSHGSGELKNDSLDSARHRPRTDSGSSSASLDNRRSTAYNDSESGDDTEDSTSFNNENVNNNDPKMTLMSPTAESKIKQRHIQYFHLNGNDQLVEVVKILFEGEETKKLTVDAEGDLCIWQHFLTFLSTDDKIHLKISLFDVTNFKHQKVFLQFNKLIITAGKQKFVFAREEELEGTLAVLKHLHASRDINVPLMVLGEPIQHMLGALKYPKENKKFRKIFNLPETEAIVAFFSCKFGDRTLSPKGKLYASRFHIGFDNGSGLVKSISFENIKSIKESSKKSIVIELPNESYTFSAFNNRSAVFKLLEKLWNEVYKKVRVAIFTPTGNINRELFESTVNLLRSNADANIRWIMFQNSHGPLPSMEKMKALNIDIYNVKDPKSKEELADLLKQMDKLVILACEVDSNTINQVQALVECSPQQLRQVICVTTTLSEGNDFLSCCNKTVQTFVEEAPMPFTFIRSNGAVMQLFKEPFIRIKKDSCFRLPLPRDKKYAWVDVNDVARMVALVTSCPRATEAEHYRKMYYVSGPEALSCEEVSQIYAGELNSETFFEELEMSQYKEYLMALKKEVLDMQKEASPVLSVIQSGLTTIGSLVVPSSTNSSSDGGIHPAIDEYETKQRRRILSTLLPWTNNSNNNNSSGVVNDPDATKQWEDYTDWKIDRLVELFKALNAFDTHNIVSPLYQEITGNEPKSFVEFVNDNVELFKDKFLMYFSSSQYTSILNQFSEINKKNTTLNLTDFTKALGFLLADEYIASRLFKAFDVERDGSVDSNDFITSLSILTRGNAEEQLQLAFKMLDSEGKGSVSKDDLTMFLKSLESTLNKYNISTKHLKDVAEVFFPPNSTVLKLNFEQFTQIVTQNFKVVQSLGRLTNKAVLPEKLLRNVKRRGLAIAFGHEQWELTQNMLLGFTKSLSKINKRLKTLKLNYLHDIIHFSEEIEEPVSSLSFSATSSLPRLTLTATSEQTQNWSFIDVAPAVFWKIREFFGVDQKEYMHTLSVERLLGSLLTGRFASLEEIASSGRSGSFFLKTEDGKYFIKTLPPDEHQFLKKILPQYWTHINRYPNTLVPRFYGLHKLKQQIMSNKKEIGKPTEIYFVVMANLFDTPYDIHEQYDLKGSTVNRSVRSEDWNSNVALKDLDFHRRIVLGPVLKSMLLEQAEIDSKWMESMNICDYSLLVGFSFLIDEDKKKLSEQPDPGPLDKSVFKQNRGGLLAGTRDRNEVYCIGIIDTLTVYDLKKKGESVLKSVLYNKKEISAISPEPYRKRFLKYLASIVD